MKYIFIVNGKAGYERAMIGVKKQLAELDEKIDYIVYGTVCQKDATVRVKRFCADYPNDEICFVACGGDGTINEVATALVGEKNKKLAALAYGSGNDYVKYYKGKDFRSIKKLIAGTSEKVDIMKINDCYSINICNFGFDAVVGSTANKVKDKGGKNPYAKGIIKGIFTARSNTIKVIANGEVITKKKMLLCTLANGNYVGGKYCCAPVSVNNDGLIDVCLFHTCSLFTFARLIKLYERGEHLSNPKFARMFEYRRVNNIFISSPKTIELCLDGEMISGTDFNVTVLPREINFVVPAN